MNDDAESVRKIEFTTRPVTVREMLLVNSIARGGPNQLEDSVDLIRRRLQDPEDIERVLDMTAPELNELATDLVKAMSSANTVEKLLQGVRK